jgi:hypothetical protein
MQLGSRLSPFGQQRDMVQPFRTEMAAIEFAIAGHGLPTL